MVADATVVSLTCVRLRAKRRWGELLGPAESGRPKNVTNGHVTGGAERKQAERARKLWRQRTAKLIPRMAGGEF